jgi:leucyl-tRNA synthetase
MKADFYCAVMFPYPSAAGLHLGHYYNYAVIDSYCRWLRHRGATVFQPFGYDAFGLPAENYARKVGRDPAEVTYANIEQFRAQLVRMNTCYQEHLVTCDPSYMKWTQWVFTRLHERGLAYKAWGEVNWCPSCETVLANEQVIDGHCERCGSAVERRDMNQWYFRITDYRDRLIAGLDRIDMPESTKRMQRAWLAELRDWCVSRQRTWGCPIPIKGEVDTLDTFVDSSFYYLRYLTDSETEFLPEGRYQPVDLYVGGVEHACTHLIYARFIHMVLFDMGIVPQEEPFRRIIHQGVIRKDGAKMSKSKGNAVSPDDYDPDELRLYLMFIGPYSEGGEWSDEHIVGQCRFLSRMRRWLESRGSDRIDLVPFEDQVDRDVRAFKFNKVVSGFMEFYNRHKNLRPDDETAQHVEELLRVFAPGFRCGRFGGEGSECSS